MNEKDILKGVPLEDKIKRILRHCNRIEIRCDEGGHPYFMTVFYERPVVMNPGIYHGMPPACMPVSSSHCKDETLEELVDNYYQRMFVCPEETPLQWKPAFWVKEQYKDPEDKKETEKCPSTP